jgi:hypothetical protein
MNTGQFSADNLNTQATPEGIIIEPQYITYLRSNGYAIDDVTAVKYAHSPDSDTAHIMMEVQTFLYPSHSDELDVAAHDCHIRACDCWDYRSNSPDVSDRGVVPVEYENCKHLENWDKHTKAAADDDQATLL